VAFGFPVQSCTTSSFRDAYFLQLICDCSMWLPFRWPLSQIVHYNVKAKAVWKLSNIAQIKIWRGSLLVLKWYIVFIHFLTILSHLLVFSFCRSWVHYHGKKLYCHCWKTPNLFILTMFCYVGLFGGPCQHVDICWWLTMFKICGKVYTQVLWIKTESTMGLWKR